MPEINQKEALCHMQYACNKCRKVDLIWNSRPRVTPFMVGCSAEGCNGDMIHVNWEQDRYDPNYQPVKSDRIFVDWSRSDEEKMRKKQVEEEWNKGDCPMCERTDLWTTKEEAVQYFLDQWEFGQPTTETL